MRGVVKEMLSQEDSFIRPYVGDVLVVFVIYFFVRIMILEKCKWLPMFIFLFAVGVEIGQYFHIAEKLGMSDDVFVKNLIGSTLDMKDIICYGVGSLILQMFVWVKVRR